MNAKDKIVNAVICIVFALIVIGGLVVALAMDNQPMLEDAPPVITLTTAELKVLAPAVDFDTCVITIFLYVKRPIRVDGAVSQYDKSLNIVINSWEDFSPDAQLAMYSACMTLHPDAFAIGSRESVPTFLGE